MSSHEQDFIIDYSKSSVIFRDRTVVLSPHEFLLLSFLHEHKNRTVSAQTLIAHIWDDGTGSEAKLKSLVTQVRGRLNEKPYHPRLLYALTGMGYQLNLVDTPRQARK